MTQNTPPGADVASPAAPASGPTRRAVPVAAVLMSALLSLGGCGADLWEAPPTRVAFPVPGEDPTQMRARTQSPVDATTIPGVTGR